MRDCAANGLSLPLVVLIQVLHALFWCSVVAIPVVYTSLSSARKAQSSLVATRCTVISHFIREGNYSKTNWYCAKYESGSCTKRVWYSMRIPYVYGYAVMKYTLRRPEDVAAYGWGETNVYSAGQDYSERESVLRQIRTNHPLNSTCNCWYKVWDPMDVQFFEYTTDVAEAESKWSKTMWAEFILLILVAVSVVWSVFQDCPCRNCCYDTKTEGNRYYIDPVQQRLAFVSGFHARLGRDNPLLKWKLHPTYFPQAAALIWEYIDGNNRIVQERRTDAQTLAFQV